MACRKWVELENMRRNSHGVHQGRLEVTLVALGLPPFLSHWFFLTKCHCEPGESFPDY